jgi:hypothetical protein
MFDEPQTLFDGVLALLEDLDRQLEEARVAAAGLLSAGRAAQRVSPVADRQRRTRLIEHSTAAALLRNVCEELNELLSAEEDRRAAIGPLGVPRVIHTPPVSGEEDPEPF